MSNLPEYKTISADKLIPYARNSRTHSDEQAPVKIKEVKNVSA